MSQPEELIDLTKKVQAVLDLRKIPEIKAQVCLAIDYSGSMSNLYSNGTVQKTVNRISAVAVKFDDNQELDVLVFSDGVDEAEPATPAMFGNYVDKEIVRKFRMGGTNYAPFIGKVVENYFSASIVSDVKNFMEDVEIASKGFFGGIKDALFGKKKESIERTVPVTKTVTGNKSKSGYPIFVIVVTDGENFDQDETTGLLAGMQDKNVYWQFVGIGNVNFEYLKDISAQLPNVGFFKIDDLETVGDMALYKQLLNEEFAAWIKQF